MIVPADDGDGRERLARYLMRPPVALARLEWDRDQGVVTYRTKAGDGDDAEADGVARFDELDFLARVIVQLPPPRKHQIRYYGAYSAVGRARRRDGARRDAGATTTVAANPEPERHGEPDAAARNALRKKWAQMISHIYEVDPLLCPCGGKLRVIAFITEWETIAKILAHLRGHQNRDEPGEGPGAGRPPPARPGPAPGLSPG